MSALPSVVLPVFGVLVLGFAAGRFRLLAERGVEVLVLFVFNLAIPALFLRGMADMELPEEMRWGFLSAFYAGSFLVYGAGMAWAGLVEGRAGDEGAVFGMAAAVSNTVLLGVPVVLTAFGPEASFPLFLIIAFHSATFLPLTIVLIQAGRGGLDRQALAPVAGAVLKNPIILAILAGFLMNRLATGLPLWLDRITTLLGDTAIPCALFAMGATLAGYPLRGAGRSVAILAVLKLVAHPVAVWVVAVPILGLSGLDVAVAMVLAAMPSAVNVYLFGARYEAAGEEAARTVFVSSVFSVATVSMLLVLLDP